MMKGSLEVIAGCMFSGKTDELLRRVERLVFANKPFIVVKPAFDTRYSKDEVVAHRGQRVEALLLTRGQETWQELNRVSEGKLEKAQVVAFDEGNFFSSKLVELCLGLIEQGKRVIVAGLDLNFRAEPFGPMSDILAYADEVTKLKAVCVKCGREDADRTQRMTAEGKPAPKNSPLIIVGGKKSDDQDYYYEARCKDCHELPEC